MDARADELDVQAALDFSEYVLLNTARLWACPVDQPWRAQGATHNSHAAPHRRK